MDPPSKLVGANGVDILGSSTYDVDRMIGYVPVVPLVGVGDLLGAFLFTGAGSGTSSCWITSFKIDGSGPLPDAGGKPPGPGDRRGAGGYGTHTRQKAG